MERGAAQEEDINIAESLEGSSSPLVELEGIVGKFALKEIEQQDSSMGTRPQHHSHL